MWKKKERSSISPDEEMQTLGLLTLDLEKVISSSFPCKIA